MGVATLGRELESTRGEAGRRRRGSVWFFGVALGRWWHIGRRSTFWQWSSVATRS